MYYHFLWCAYSYNTAHNFKHFKVVLLESQLRTINPKYQMTSFSDICWVLQCLTESSLFRFPPIPQCFYTDQRLILKVLKGMERNSKPGNIYSEGSFKEQETGFRINLSVPFEYETTMASLFYFILFLFWFWFMACVSSFTMFSVRHSYSLVTIAMWFHNSEASNVPPYSC